MSPTLHYSRCDSSNLSVRPRKFTDVLATWGQYVINFLFSGIGKEGFHGAGSSAEQRFDWEAHRGLATGRWFWRRRDRGEEGTVFDDVVLQPVPLGSADKTPGHLSGDVWTLHGDHHRDRYRQ